MKKMHAFVVITVVATTFNAVLPISKAESVEGLDNFISVLMYALPAAELAPSFAPLGKMTRYEFKGKDESGSRSVIRVVAYHQRGTVQWIIIHDDATVKFDSASYAIQLDATAEPPAGSSQTPSPKDAPIVEDGKPVP
jgi:hypothetical protein